VLAKGSILWKSISAKKFSDKFVLPKQLKIFIPNLQLKIYTTAIYTIPGLNGTKKQDKISLPLFFSEVK
jgi:hypothetical protein